MAMGTLFSNLTYTTTEAVDAVGLFGCTDDATIQNLGVENVLISSRGNYVGGLVGIIIMATLTACYATGSVSGTNQCRRAGGGNYYGSLTACYATGSVSGT